MCRLENLWEQVGNACLNRANEILKTKTVLSSKQVRTVKELVDIAINIDSLNLHWAGQNRFDAAVVRGSLSLQPKVKN